MKKNYFQIIAVLGFMLLTGGTLLHNDHHIDEPRVIQVTALANGYDPAKITLKKGETVKLVVTRKTDSMCAAKIKFPDFGIATTDLPKDKPVTFTIKADKKGTFKFTCGMNMLKGTIVVSEK
ncbi:MAG: cupredoxin domain-containing protein [Rhodothermia bacterium]|nr:cupredoxin domain-containing protein [Rhodothermia bacterium]